MHATHLKNWKFPYVKFFFFWPIILKLLKLKNQNYFNFITILKNLSTALTDSYLRLRRWFSNQPNKLIGRPSMTSLLPKSVFANPILSNRPKSSSLTCLSHFHLLFFTWRHLLYHLYVCCCLTNRPKSLFLFLAV